MKTIGLIIAMLFTTTVLGATPAKIESITIGQRVFTDLDNLKKLWCQVTTSNRYSTCYDSSGSAYSPNGVNFRIRAIRINTNAAGKSLCYIGYGDSVVGINSASAPTSEVAFHVAAASINYPYIGTSLDSAYEGANGYAVNNLVPDGSGTSNYVTVKCGTAGVTHIFLYGYEETP